MAAEIGLLPSTQYQKLPQSQQNYKYQHHQPNLSRETETETPSLWMWNPKQAYQEDDDSWEVRAFAEDTGNMMGTTWPPRSYTCTFCRREFRSAQALGGHMNVHRRDRARLHQTQPPTSSINPINLSTSASSSSTFILPTHQEFPPNAAGLCLLYQLSNPNGIFTPTTVNECAIDSPSALVSITPYPPHNNLIGQSLNFSAVAPTGMNSNSLCYNSFKAEPNSAPSDNNGNAVSNNNNNNCDEFANEELDLELRLGQRLKTSSS